MPDLTAKNAESAKAKQKLNRRWTQILQKDFLHQGNETKENFDRMEGMDRMGERKERRDQELPHR